MTTAPTQAHDRTDAFPSHRTLLVSCLVAAVLASAIMVLLHECAHLVAGIALGHRSTLYPYGVTHAGDLSPAHVAITSLAAPVFSLVVGLAMNAWQPFRAGRGFAHPLWGWVAFASMMEGVGYLVITPMGAGDTATAAEAMGWGVVIQLLMMAVGVGLQFLVGRLFARHVGEWAGDDRSRIMNVTMWPWLIATAVNIALASLYIAISGMGVTTGEMVAILAAGTAMLVFAPMSLIFARVIRATPPRPLALSATPVAGLVGIAVMVGLNLALTRGLPLG